jgi:hypothetical protein
LRSSALPRDFVNIQDMTPLARLEKYLKSGSGHAFANKRLWPDPMDLQD